MQKLPKDKQIPSVKLSLSNNIPLVNQPYPILSLRFSEGVRMYFQK